MPEAIFGQPPNYHVTCVHCGARFDALTVDFCGCVVKERTVVCPDCHKCFCTAPTTVRQNFWVNAPEALWRRRAALTGVAKSWVNAKPEAVRRPLVLIVDDEVDVRAAAIAMVESLGYGVIVATNGDQGIELAHKYRPEVVLTDAFMPRLDGREMGGRIKASPALAGTKVVVMTSLYRSAQQKHEALSRFKVDGYLTKPLEPEQLKNTLAAVLGALPV